MNTDYNLAADKEAKEKMISQMLRDMGCEGLKGYWEPWQQMVCDKLIRAGWRKVSHE